MTPDAPLDRRLCILIGSLLTQGHEAPAATVSEAVDELDRLRQAEADLACLLRKDVRGDNREGYEIVGLYCSPGGSFATRQEAEARLLGYARRSYPASSPPPEADQ